MARYGALRKRGHKIGPAIERRARRGLRQFDRRVNITVDIRRAYVHHRIPGAGYCAEAIAGRRDATGCAKTPTAALKKALTQLTRKIK